MPTRAEKRIALFIFIAFIAAQVLAAPPDEPVPPDQELIVLLRLGPTHPTPQQVIDAVNAGDPAPGGLGEGNPMAGQFAIRSRAHGPMKAFYEANPDLAAARLQRYIVLQYPNPNAVGGILTALAANPNVEHVERNRAIKLHAVPSDPFFPPNGDPEAHQWGPNLMNLPAAWDLIEGHAMLGFIDTGIEPGHPEMEPFDDSGIVPVFEGGTTESTSPMISSMTTATQTSKKKTTTIAPVTGCMLPASPRRMPITISVSPECAGIAPS